MSRRGENIYKRKDGRWEGRYIKRRDTNQKAVYGYLYGKNYAEVKNKLELVKSDISKQIEVTDSFELLVIEWLEGTKLKVKESTLAHYKSIVDNHIIPVLGRYKLSEIPFDCVPKYLSKLMEEGFSAKTANDILVIIKGIFKYASSKGLKHYCNLSYLTVKNEKSKVKTLSKSEQNKLTKYCIDSIDNRNFGILLSLYMGIRIGELCALRWSDIDAKERVLKISKTMLRIHNDSDDEILGKTKVIISTPKSNDSVRSIPIPNFIFGLIRNFQKVENAYILTNSLTKYLEPRAMQYYFKSVLKKCCIDDINYHALRHTFATRCVEQGFEIKSLSEILGHSSIKITLDRYVHSSLELKRENMDKLSLIQV